MMQRQFHSQRELENFARELSLMARPGSLILLKGAMGAGKSVFARAFIRALAPGKGDFEIPSPTFTLVQTYDETRVPVIHVDLYRLDSMREVQELGLEEFAQSRVLLVEWAERGDWRRWSDVLEVEISGSGTSRMIRMSAAGGWLKALLRDREIEQFIAGTDWKDAKREFLEGDASSRRYELLRRDNRTEILMDMPARPDGPPVLDGKPYSAVAHLAEDIRAVIAVTRELRARGYSAPAIHAFDIPKGLAIIENLEGAVFGRMVLAGEDMREPMRTAVEVLAAMAGRAWPASVKIDGGYTHAVPPYDEHAQLIEVDLLPSWFWPYLHGIEVPERLRAGFAEAWREVLPLARRAPAVWTLRDYHSPNLIWLPDRQGLQRVGLIDTQDCVLGDPAYDLASMLQDARVDLDPELTAGLFDHYCELRAAAPEFDRESFAAAYAILGAQRATKILGIFARLSKRDGKHGYLKHMPRVSGYLETNLQHPALHRLKKWFDTHLTHSVRRVPE